MFQREQEIFIQLLRLLPRLLQEPATLDQRIGQLGVTRPDFLAVDDQLIDIDE